VHSHQPISEAAWEGAGSDGTGRLADAVEARALAAILRQETVAAARDQYLSSHMRRALFIAGMICLTSRRNA
jgi:hypothetical protein